jgi:hypothetical protein
MAYDKVCRVTVQVIEQVESEFRAQGYGVNLQKNTVNWYVALGKIGMFPLTWGYEGTMPQHTFNLPVLVVEAFIQISQVNSVMVVRQQLLMTVNMCCGVVP